MSRKISWNIQLAIQDGQYDNSRILMEEMVASTRKESGVLRYEWYISADHKICHISEAYVDSQAVATHLQTFAHHFLTRFMTCFQPTQFTVYGAPSNEVQQVTDGFGAVYLGEFGGFSK